MKRLLLAAAILAMPVPALAQGAGAEQEAPKKEKRICRSEKVTGSLTKVNRICMTQRQWDELAARTKRGMDEMQADAAGGANSAWQPGANGQ